MDNTMSINFISLSENESFARVAACAFVAGLNPTAAELAEIKTAISEAVTNAIVHGYCSEVGMVRLDGKIHNNTVEFSVIDDGCGIEDVKKARTPLYTGNPEMERSGLGFSIMESFMDSVEVTSKLGVGTTVKMVKKIV